MRLLWGNILVEVVGGDEVVGLIVVEDVSGQLAFDLVISGKGMLTAQCSACCWWARCG